LLHQPVSEQLPASWLQGLSSVEVIADRAALELAVEQG
jgi:6-phosphogluconolactonase/glucosamine-6-phosphate isomerase/deaminase